MNNIFICRERLYYIINNEEYYCSFYDNIINSNMNLIKEKHKNNIIYKIEEYMNYINKEQWCIKNKDYFISFNIGVLNNKETFMSFINYSLYNTLIFIIGCEIFNFENIFIKNIIKPESENHKKEILYIYNNHSDWFKEDRKKLLERTIMEYII